MRQKANRLSMRLSRLLAALAIAFAALGALPPVVATVRALLSLRYVEHYTIHSAWHALYVGVGLVLFVWVHLAWDGKAARSAVGTCGAICAVSSVAAGVLVWTMAPRFWIVWPTYGHYLGYGICVWALATARPGGKVMAVAVTVTTGGLIMLFPSDLRASVVGVYAIVSLFAFLWVVGVVLPNHQRIARLCRVSLAVCLGYYAAEHATESGWLCFVAILLTELRTVIAPLRAGQESPAAFEELGRAR